MASESALHVIAYHIIVKRRDCCTIIIVPYRAVDDVLSLGWLSHAPPENFETLGCMFEMHFDKQ